MFKAAARPALRGGLVSARKGEGSRGTLVTFSASDSLSRKATAAHFELFVKKKDLNILGSLKKGKLLITNYAQSYTTVKYIVY